MRAIAAGHPATADAGAEILQEGGSAADAAVAATLASCVAETVMTGLFGGGHGIYFDAATGRARNLDCFVAVPGLGADRREVALVELDIPFGIELVHYAVGIGSCGVPGVPAGLDALWKAYGRLPWPRLVEPALRLARESVPMPAAHAACLRMLEPVMTMNEGARIYSPGGSLLDEGDPLRQPGLVSALEAVSTEGARSAYEGAVGRALLALMEERGGFVTKEDLNAYDAVWSEPVELGFRGYELRTRAGLTDFPGAAIRLRGLRGLEEPEQALALVAALLDELPAQNGTTNVSVLDDEGNACVLTTSLGLGSGDFVPGLDLHLNSMLGEADLFTEGLGPGDRMASMMAPTLALDYEGVVLGAGAAGGTRLRSALLRVVAGILDEQLEPQAAVDRPRVHPAGSLVHLEAGFGPATIAALESAGFEVRSWPSRHHYFGGVSVVTRSAAGADPRRSGAARVV
ncbi:MAG TPA: gamma-glutamyltransferase [Gaiellaceae bacterium]|jgi:gamma-glutamyltranspeptidase / glutathione hydrolase